MTEREEIINSLNACMDVHRSGLWSSGCAFCSYAKQSNPKCFMNLTRDAVALLREQPKIVRCKDCIYHHYTNDSTHIPYCELIDYGYGWQDDDFCSRGKRGNQNVND